jgi:hypothetical protein
MGKSAVKADSSHAIASQELFVVPISPRCRDGTHVGRRGVLAGVGLVVAVGLRLLGVGLRGKRLQRGL